MIIRHVFIFNLIIMLKLLKESYALHAIQVNCEIQNDYLCCNCMKCLGLSFTVDHLSHTVR